MLRIQTGNMAKTTKKLKWAVLALFLLLISAVVFAVSAHGFILLTKKTYLLLCGLLALLCAVLGFISFSYKKGKSGIVAVINVLLSVFLISGSMYLPIMEKKPEEMNEQELLRELLKHQRRHT